MGAYLSDLTPVCKSLLDVGFVIDSSWSVRVNYQNEKNFVKQMAASFKLDSEGPVAGVITFSADAYHNIKLKDFKMKDLASFNDAVDDMAYLASKTRIDKALKLARDEMFTTENGARDKVPKVLITVIDGTQTADTGAEDPNIIAEQLRQNGISTFFVGIGPEVTDAVLLRLAGGRNDTIFHVNTFDGLDQRSFVDAVLARTCEPIDGNFFTARHT